MRLSRAESRTLLLEIGISLSIGLVAAFIIPATAMARIDDMVVTFLSIILAAVIPGVALTAAAPRPATDSPLEARKLGVDLEGQVRFWFGFLLVGGLSVLCILAASALDWQLSTPRIPQVPFWIPGGSAWLVFVSLASVTFTAIRARHVANAIVDLIRLGTEAHASQAKDRLRREHNEIGAQIRSTPPSPERGNPVSGRERVPRPPPN